MKKVLAGILTAAMISVIGVTSAFAAGAGRNCNYVDADGDGYCDYSQENCVFIDEDEDGICDNYSVDGHHSEGRCRGRGHGTGRGNGHGCQRNCNR